VTVTDVGGKTPTIPPSEVSLTVVQTLSNIAVTGVTILGPPSNMPVGSVLYLLNDDSQQFTATEFDQFDNPMDSQPTSFAWALDGHNPPDPEAAPFTGTLSSTGDYTAPDHADVSVDRSAAVTASAGGCVSAPVVVWTIQPEAAPQYLEYVTVKDHNHQANQATGMDYDALLGGGDMNYVEPYDDQGDVDLDIYAKLPPLTSGAATPVIHWGAWQGTQEIAWGISIPAASRRKYSSTCPSTTRTACAPGSAAPCRPGARRARGFRA
jgi:hypothetical protein